MNLIAAVDQNWAIGNKNELLVRIPADQKFFRETTTGKVVDPRENRVKQELHALLPLAGMRRSARR